MGVVTYVLNEPYKVAVVGILTAILYIAAKTSHYIMT